jgi:hypothetical protein
MPCAPPSAGLFAVENLSHHLVTKINRGEFGERRKGRFADLRRKRHDRQEWAAMRKAPPRESLARRQGRVTA